MQLVIPVDLPARREGDVAIYDIVPGATFEIHPIVPLPPDLATFGRELVFGAEPARVRIKVVSEDKTALGWPVTIAASELVDDAGAITEFRVHIVFQFADYGGIAIVRAASDDACRAAVDKIKPLVDRARPDFTTGDITALAQIWAGF